MSKIRHRDLAMQIMTTWWEESEPHNGWATKVSADHDIENEDLYRAITLKRKGNNHGTILFPEDIVNAMQVIRVGVVELPRELRLRVQTAYALDFYDDLTEKDCDAIVKVTAMYLG